MNKQEHEDNLETHKLLGTAYGLLAVIAGCRDKPIPERTWGVIDEFLRQYDERRNALLEDL